MNHCLKYLKILLPLLFLLACSPQEDFDALPKYLKSATYFSDEWVLNFWNSESDHMEEELQQIAADGFNSIILVVPWREFQPDLDPIAYNEYALAKLDRVMEAAKAQGLWVSLRVGYTWDYWDDGTDVRARFRELLADAKTQEAWDDYVTTIYERANAHGNLYGGFLTWEDYWSFTGYAMSLGNTEESVYWASYSGYTDYLRGRYSLEELSRLYGQEIAAYEDLYLPGAKQPALCLLYEFFDQWLNQFLAHNQELFPNLSMEVRMDADRVYDENGDAYWYGHEVTYGCQASTYTSLMYGVPIGHLNEGERLEAAEAAAKSQEMLDSVLAHTGGKRLYIEQFLYMDNTPGFEHNAQVKEDQLDDYLRRMAEILKPRIVGYGVWAYRNYGNNLLYNPQFALGEAGWQLENGAAVESYDGSSQAALPAGGRLSNPVASEGLQTYVSFTVTPSAFTTLSVTLGSDEQTVTVEESGLVELTYENGGTGLSITADAPCHIDNVKVYTRVQEGELYQMDGSEGSCIQAIRALNKKLR